MSEAGAVRCPSCGAWLPAEARSCSHCKVEIASVRCGKCFALHYAGSSSCSRCGAMLGLEAQLGPTERPCPRCADATTLMAIELEEYRLEECPACTGVFVEHVVLERISRRTDAERGVRARPAPKSTIDATAPVRYRKCPLCADVMTRRNFGDRSGVIVDVCARHGVWFDSDELTRILEFVASGGVAAGALEAVAQKERAERVKRRMAAVSRDPGTLADDESTGLFVDIAATITDFIKWY